MTVPPEQPVGVAAGPDRPPDAAVPVARPDEPGRGDGSSVLGGGNALGRRGFVAGALVAGAGAAVATRLPGSREPQGGPTAPFPGSTVVSGTGIDPSGAENSTRAFQAVVDASPEGGHLWLPAGVYLVDGIVLRTGQFLAGPSARTYLGRPSSGARLRARLAEQTAPVLTVGEFGRVADVAVEGNDRRQPAVRPAGPGVVLERVAMLDASVGFDGGYASGSVLRECQIHENGVGIQDIVDSVVQTSAINANRGDGISLGPGANDNTIVGNKIEWNDGHGLQAFQAVHNVLLGGVVDRNGRTGARLVECASTVVLGAVFRRNGRLSERTPADDCHIYQENCTALVVTGISTDHGRDDDDVSGYASPAVAIREEGGSDVTITGSDLTGCTSGVAVATGAPATRRTLLLNAGVSGVQTASGTRVRIAVADLTVAAGSSGSVEFDVEGTAGGDAGALYRLHVIARNVATGARGAAEALLLVMRDGRTAAVTVGAVENRIGHEFGPSAAYRLRATVSPDGAALTVWIDNGGTGVAALRLELV